MKRGLLTLSHTIPTFNVPEKKPFENIAGKGDNAGKQHFLLFPQCFLLIKKKKKICDLFCHLQVLRIWTSLKFCHLVKSKRIC